MGKNVGGIFRQKVPASLALIREFKEEFTVRVGPLKKRRPEQVPLREKGSRFPCVAGLRSRLNTPRFIDIRSEILVNGHILGREEIVVLVVGIEIFHDFCVKRDLQRAAVPFDLDIAVIRRSIYGCRKRSGKTENARN